MSALPALQALILAAAAQPSAPVERLTVEQATQLVLEASPQLRAARARAEAGEEQVKSHRGRFLPSINLSDEQQHWDSPFAIGFPAGPGAELTLVARNINTNTFAAAAGQPLLGLWRLSEEHGALSRGAEAAGLDARTVESSLKEEVQTLFLRLFEARALVGVARSSQELLAEQVQVAKDKLKAGVLTQADVLRLQTALANARQQEIQASASEQVARAGLLADLGRPAEDPGVEFLEPPAPEQPDASQQDLGPLVDRALGARTEVQGAQRLAESAGKTARARTLELLPEVGLEGGYIHINGQIFAPKDAEFVGIKADWQVWDWGAKFFNSRAAARQADAARSQAAEVRRRVQLDVAARLAGLRAAAAALDAARAAIVSAEEAYRVTAVQVNAGAASTTDLLDAHSALTQARLNFARARYEQAIAKVGLARSVGEI